MQASVLVDSARGAASEGRALAGWPGSGTVRVLLAASLLGAGVLAGFYFGGRPPASAPARREPAWVERAPRLPDFTALITASPAPSPADDPAKHLAGLLGFSGEITSVRSTWHMTRVLPQGFEFDSLLNIEAVAADQADTGTVWLRVVRRAQEVAAYRADFQAGQVRLRHGQAGEPLREAAQTDTDAPLSIGDVRLQDVLSLREALVARRLRRVGGLANLNAEALEVYEVALEVEAAAEARKALGRGVAERNPALATPPAHAAFDGRGALALLYCRQDLTPRSMRVFDRAGRLVRTYSGLRFEPGQAGDQGPPLRLVQLNVASVPSDSNSFLRLAAATFASGRPRAGKP